MIVRTEIDGSNSVARTTGLTHPPEEITNDDDSNLVGVIRATKIFEIVFPESCNGEKRDGEWRCEKLAELLP